MALRSAAAQRLAELAAHVGDGDRLARGRRYHRKGLVHNVEVEPGAATASVQGGRENPYEVVIACKPANENDMRSAALDIADAVPRVGDVAFTCICPDWGDPCKHGIAALLELAREVDDDPAVLLRWRGIDDVVPSPPPGTEPLLQRDDAAPAEDSRVDAIAALRVELGDTVPDVVASDFAAAELVEPGTGVSDSGTEDALTSFFCGAVPRDGAAMVAPLEEVPLEVFADTRIVIDNIDAGPAIADALAAIAEHWLRG